MSILHGDCREVLATLPAESVDASVTDPPYNLEFMGKSWDSFGGSDGYQAWSEGWAREVYRVLKPGAHILVCGAPRAYHRMACGIEDAGFEIRDCLAWIFGSGFPKSLNLGEGLGTALKPANEPILMARKPFKGTVRGNVTAHGTGALNIEACRVDSDGGALTRGVSGGGSFRFDGFSTVTDLQAAAARGERTPTGRDAAATLERYLKFQKADRIEPSGRWPANVVLDDLAAMVLDEQSGACGGGSTTERDGKTFGILGAFAGGGPQQYHGEVDGASRFFYCAKPSRAERDIGCYDLPARSGGEATDREDDSAGLSNPRAGAGRNGGVRNYHPTVKPVELMRWLVRLVTPVGGTVIDPFLGSGTTGMAARYEQRGFIGIEREAEYIEIAARRIAACVPLFNEPAGVVADCLKIQAALK